MHIEGEQRLIGQPMTIFELANVEEDYFKKPANLTKEEKTQALRAQMEESALKFKELS